MSQESNLPWFPFILQLEIPQTFFACKGLLNPKKDVRLDIFNEKTTRSLFFSVFNIKSI